MSDSTLSSFFVNATVSTTSFADCHYTWKFDSVGMLILNTGSATVEYSFDGANVCGDLTSSFAGVSFDNRQECQIWFRLKTSGSSTVRLEAWAAQ